MVSGLDTEPGAQEHLGMWLCVCAVAGHEGMPWLSGSLLTLAVPSPG